MVFSSLTFLAYFFVVTLIIYFAFPKLRNITLAAASLLFYAFGEPIYIVLLVVSSTIDYIVSRFLDKTEDRKKRIFLLCVSVVMNLSLLGFFKYANFIVASINGAFGLAIPSPNVPLPIGISFYTFQTLSYTIDVYRKNTKANKNYLDFLMYISMFPQLIAGPIVRYVDIEKQLKVSDRPVKASNLEEGSVRFIQGLAKKVLLADQLAAMNQAILAGAPSTVGYWISMIAYALQIYFDFSGYSDMAIGLGKIFGFDFLENFNYPYISKSVSEFWRRWHMSLGNWFRDYVYFPLGGSRVKSKFRLIFNLAVVWFLTGLWHGASWNFVLWGVYFGIFIILEKLFLQRILDKLPKFIQHFYLLIIVLFGWVLFAFENMNQVITVLKGMLGIGVEFVNLNATFYLQNYLVIFVLGIILAFPYAKRLFEKLPYVVRTAILTVLFIYTIFAISDSTFSPFIYFRF